MNGSRTGSVADGVRLALVSNRLEGIVRKMANTLLRTGRSGVLNTARDFSCCIVTAGDELLAAAESLPIHVLSGPDVMARSMREFHPQLARGDAFLHNSPYHGCSHPADHTLLVPVIDEAGKFTLRFSEHNLPPFIGATSQGGVVNGASYQAEIHLIMGYDNGNFYREYIITTDWYTYRAP